MAHRSSARWLLRLARFGLPVLASCAGATALHAQTTVITPVPGSTALPVAPTAPAVIATPPSMPQPVQPSLASPVVTLPLAFDPNSLRPAPPASAVRSGPVLTLAEAERAAIAANPRITAAHLLALAAGQVVRETRAGELPVVTGSITAVDAHPNSRITAGALNNPIVYNRAAAGFTGSALLSDFGRTRDLIRAAHSRADAAQQDARATAADITLAVDQAYFAALAAQSQLDVAQQAVATRTQTVDQIRALTAAKLRSTLDLSFASVDLSEARLTELDAANARAAAMNTLQALMGRSDAAAYTLTDPAAGAPAAPPRDAEPLIQMAFAARPDLLSLALQATAADQFSQAEHKLNLPTVSALGATGVAPVRDDRITTSWYGAAGINVSVPVFNGFLYDARAKQAAARAQASHADTLALRNAIARDVREAVLEAQNDWERITVSEQLLTDAGSAQSLASTRYTLGLSSAVELSQSQLAQTQAQIGLLNARYTYQLSLLALRYQTGQ